MAQYNTETITLTSEGLVYPKESPLSKGKLEMKYPTLKEEDILMSSNLLKEGTAVNKFIESLIQDDIDVNELIIGDINGLMIAARILAFGPEYQIKFNCIISC